MKKKSQEPLMGYELRSKLANAKPQPKQYTWADVATYETFALTTDPTRLTYSVRMRDGQHFTGEISRDTNLDEARGDIIGDINRQVAAGQEGGAA